MTGWGATGQVQVRRLGLSRVGDYTLLTIVLDRPAEPRIFVGQAPGKPQVVLEFSQAWLGAVPTRMAGDDLLVQQVQTETIPGGVRITLDLYPDQPYSYWRRSQPAAGRENLFILGLKTLARAQPQQPAPASPQGSLEAGGEPEREAPQPPAYSSSPSESGKESQPAPSSATAVPGGFSQLSLLLPKAGGLLQSLQNDGWIISETHDYDRPGQRNSRDFTLINYKYPELDIKILHLPSDAPGTPNIGIISLSTDNLKGEDESKYQELRQWNFAKIKRHYEDIGDFFEDALKPLRIKLREKTKAVALKDAAVFQNFLRAVSPGDPQVADKVMAHVREKVNPRFEGVQYTVSQNPLIFLNMVDFLYVKVFYLDSP